MIHSICARLALPLLLVGAVGCQQPASKKPSPPTAYEPGTTGTAPAVLAPNEVKLPTDANRPVFTPQGNNSAPTPASPASSVAPPSSATPAPLAALPAAAATSAVNLPATTPQGINPAPTPASPASSVAPPSSATPAPAAALPAGVAPTAPVIVGETGTPMVVPPQDLGPELTQSLNSAMMSQPLPPKIDTSRNYMPESSRPTLPGSLGN